MIRALPKSFQKLYDPKKNISFRYTKNFPELYNKRKTPYNKKKKKINIKAGSRFFSWFRAYIFLISIYLYEFDIIMYCIHQLGRGDGVVESGSKNPDQPT